MYIRKKALSRRTLLRGAGAAVALPLLDAMVPAATAIAQTAAAPKIRTGFFYLPHGAIMNNTPYGAEADRWTPSGSGANYKLGHILEPLEAYKAHVTSFSELENLAPNNSVHTIVPATWLSCTGPDLEAAGASMAPTVDQLIAARLGQDTAIPSLELCSETTIQVAACSGAGCYYASTLSYSDPYSPLPMEFNPRKVYLQLFGEGDTAEEREALIRQSASLLDHISAQTQSLRLELGASDRAVLNDYLDTVREIERRVELASARDLTGVDVPAAPIGELDNFEEQVKLMFDLLAIAYQADLTRIASYMMVSEGTNRTYNHIGVPDAFHPMSHHANDRGRLERLAKVQRWHVQQFADFIDKLAATPDGENTLFENSLFMYGSNMSNSDRHNNYPLPVVLVGRGAGAVKGGQHIELPERTPLANVHLTMLERLGLGRESFGNSTGLISEV